MKALRPTTKIEPGGFVERPTTTNPRIPRNGLTSRLMETAVNGKAIVVPSAWELGGYRGTLAARGLRVRSQKQLDDTVIAWCERIEETP